MLTKAGADAAAILDLTEDEMREVKQLSQLFELEELTECARIFAQNDLVQKNQGTPQLGLELAFLACVELHRRPQASQSPDVAVQPRSVVSQTLAPVQPQVGPVARPSPPPQRGASEASSPHPRK